MNLSALTALSPLDGRYASRMAALRPLLSEFGLMHRRVQVEIEWLKALAAHPDLAEIAPFSPATIGRLEQLVVGFSTADGARVKAQKILTIPLAVIVALFGVILFIPSREAFVEE